MCRTSRVCFWNGMSQWKSTKARCVLTALLDIGWSIKRHSGSQRTLEREGWPNYVFAFHDNDEIGPFTLRKRWA
jgi:predicted RNA binding protein YcfA (HicA-like mRNA interferase family)